MDGILKDPITYPSRNLPVLYEGQVVVAGVTFAGISTALKLAKAIRRVMLVEPRTYLGWEAMACLRPWVCVDGSENTANLPEIVRECLHVSDSTPVNRDGILKYRLHPDRVKIRLEDLLRLLAVLVVTDLIPVEEAFTGFSNSALSLAASVSYLTPLEPSCLMVYGPGRYRFVDFLKVGVLLTIIIYMIVILLVPIVWPL